jgi:lysophospholipase L1-like esterase
MNWIKGARDTWLIIGAVILLFLILESACFIGAVIYNPCDTSAYTPPYKDFKQVKEFWIEHDKAIFEKDLIYVPYHLWRRPQFSGKWTNINANGDRVTYYNADENTEGVKKIFMFGGSTLWGTGLPDWETIPSYVSKFLNEDNPRYIIYNYGETGFVDSQGLNRLISEIKKGNIPDLAIFYSGANDACNGAYFLFALKTPSYHSYMDRFEKVFTRDKITKFIETLKTTYTYKAIIFVKNRVLPRFEYTIKQEDRDEAIRKTVRYWASNYKIASAIGKEYGFEVITFLQPALLSDQKTMQDYEKRFLEEHFILSKSIKGTYKGIREVIKKESLSGVYDISDLFEKIDEPIYIDWVHVGPLGSQYIARKMVEILSDKGY